MYIMYYIMYMYMVERQKKLVGFSWLQVKICKTAK